MKTLYTDRLILRPWQDEDLQDLYEYASNPNVGPNAGWPVHKSLEDSLDILHRILQTEGEAAIVHAGEGKVIGSVGLHNRTPDPREEAANCREIGYVLHPAYWGCGYMPEAVRRVLAYAFEELSVDEVFCLHFDFNARSRRVIEKVGFIYRFSRESKLTQLDGRTVKSLVYSIRREEYPETVTEKA